MGNNIEAITFKLGMTVDLCMAYMLMFVLMTLTFTFKMFERLVLLVTLYTTPRANTINQHNISHHFYADDSQLQNSDSLKHQKTFPLFLRTVSDCYVDINNWVTQNKLLLKADKTETVLVGSKQKLASVSVSSIQLGENHIPLSESP